MIIKKTIQFIFIMFFFLSNLFFNFTQVVDAINVNLDVGSCNDNGVCEAGLENTTSCPTDCTPVVPPSSFGNNRGGSIINNVLSDFTVDVNYNSVVIQWKSTIPSMSIVKWGTNEEYNDGSLQNIKFILNHKVEITNLKEGTFYYYKIQTETFLGQINTVPSQVFKTLSLAETISLPNNPTNVKAFSDSTGINLYWNNPKDLNFDYVRIMRSTDRFHGSPNTGKLVYEGKGNSFIDVNVISGEKYFYTLFSRNTTREYSSGSLVSIVHNPKGEDTWGTYILPIENPKQTSAQFIATQDQIVYDFNLGSILKFNGDKNINIKTNYTTLIHDDDIWIDVRNSKREIIDKYLFSQHKDEKGFVSVDIPSFEKSGYYSISISGYENGVEQIINQGAFQITKVDTNKSHIYRNQLYIIWSIVTTLIILSFLYLLFIIISRLFKYFR